jgi:hypothetical protein
MPARLGLVACLGALALDVGATATLAGAMGTANDLFPRWYGARAWLLSGLDPYSPAVDDGIRTAMGGAPGEALGAFVFGFVYPGYVALLLVPLAVLPFQLAATLWLLMAQAAIVGSAILVQRAIKVELRRRTASSSLAVIAAVLFPAALINLAFGQFAALVLLALAASWHLLAHGRLAWAGLALALALVKPSLALLPSAALLLWAARHRDRGGHLVRAWCIAVLCLGAASLLALPGWPVAFLRSSVQYAGVATAVSAAGLAARTVAEHLGEPGRQAVPILTVAIASVATLAVLAGWQASRRQAGDALAAGVLLGSWLVPPLYEWNSILLLIPLLKLADRAGHTFALFEPSPRGRSAFLVLGALAALGLALGATLVAIALRPSESRLIWPFLALAAWGLPALARYRGRKSATLRAGSSPSVATST